MAASQYDSSIDSQSYVIAPDTNPGRYDGTSSESAASSPLNCNGFENIYSSNGFVPYPSYPVQYPMSVDGLTPIGLIPVELDMEGLYEDHDRRRRMNNGNDKPVSSHVHSRRRAQNRASQRAFRDRKEKHMRELEQRLGELEARHTNLTRSYESLQVEYASVKQALDKLSQEKGSDVASSSTSTSTSTSSSSSRNFHSKSSEWVDDAKGEALDPFLFDVSAFCFDPDEGHDAR